MNDDTFGMAPGDRHTLLVPLTVALAVLATAALAVLGRSWVDSRTTAVISKGPVQILNGGFDRDVAGWAAVGKATLLRAPDHGGSLAITSSTPAEPAGAAAPDAVLVVGRVIDGAVYRVSAEIRLAEPQVRNVRLAVIGCIGGASNATRSPDLAPRLRTSTWTKVTFDARLVVASCPTMVPTIQVTAIGHGEMLLVDDISLAPR